MRILRGVLLCAAGAALLSAQQRAKNVILFLGDAGGLSALNAASIHGYGAPLKLFVQRGAPGQPPTLPASEKGAPEPAVKPNVRMENGHTGEEVLVAAQGPGSERVRGFLSNTDLFRIMLAAYGWQPPKNSD